MHRSVNTTSRRQGRHLASGVGWPNARRVSAPNRTSSHGPPATSPPPSPIPPKDSTGRATGGLASFVLPSFVSASRDFAPQPGFDLDGNMKSGPVPGTFGNTPGVQAPANATDLQWDAENRLISATVANIGTVTYQYDYLSRLIRRQFNQNTPNHYHYDGWNRVAEFLSDEAPTRTYTWGLDLSGTMQGAGGVGGLLATRHGSTSYFPFYDGNGNVTEYMNAAGGQSAHFEYDPYGTLTRRSGLIIFTYRFSTKPRDVTTGLYYYGYRWYDPVTGRWPSRDPIEESGGINLYGFVGNNGVNAWDYLGMETTIKHYTKCSVANVVTRGLFGRKVYMFGAIGGSVDEREKKLRKLARTVDTDAAVQAAVVIFLALNVGCQDCMEDGGGSGGGGECHKIPGSYFEMPLGGHCMYMCPSGKTWRGPAANNEGECPPTIPDPDSYELPE